MAQKGTLTIISGFSGVGKGTIVRELLKRYGGYALSVSMTTRAPREGEENGIAYHFVTREEFEEGIGRDGFLEYARYGVNYYGTPRAFVEEMIEAGRDVILEIEYQGALKVKEKMPEANMIYVVAPSARTVMERLIGRGTESREEVARRMRAAVEEADHIKEYDYLLVNDDLDEAVETAHRLIQCGRLKTAANTEKIDAIKAELSELAESGTL